MAIAFDTTSNGALESGTSPLNITHVMSSGANGLLVVILQMGTDAVTGVTYGGQTMTQTTKYSNDLQVGFTYVYTLLAPPTGSNTIAISFTGTQFTRAVGISYTGVKQSGLFDATSHNYDGNGPASLASTVTTVADNCWMVGYGYVTTFSSVTGATARASAGANGVLRVFDSNGVITPAGNDTATVNATAVYTVALMSIAPFTFTFQQLTNIEQPFGIKTIQNKGQYLYPSFTIDPYSLTLPQAVKTFGVSQTSVGIVKQYKTIIY